jgi:hypothetical protein
VEEKGGGVRYGQQPAHDDSGGLRAAHDGVGETERKEVVPGPCFIYVGRPAWVGPKSIMTFSNYLK